MGTTSMVAPVALDAGAEGLAVCIEDAWERLP